VRHEVSSNHPQTLSGLLDQGPALGAFLECLEQRCHLDFTVQVRARSSMAEVGRPRQAAMFDASNLESTPSDGMLLVASRAKVCRRHVGHGSVVRYSSTIEIRRRPVGNLDPLERRPCTKCESATPLSGPDRPYLSPSVALKPCLSARRRYWALLTPPRGSGNLRRCRPRLLVHHHSHLGGAS